MSGGALAGVKVLDLATLFSAPLIATMLGDFGADVVKIEPPGGDPLRVTGAMHAGGSSYVWAAVGRNKRSVVVDFDSDQGLTLLRRLTAAADVVVVNQPQAVLAKWGCAYEDVAARNRAAVVVAVSGFGASGPYAARPGAGTLAEAFAGVTHLMGEADGPPMLPSIPLGDVVTAWAGVAGALTALHWRDGGGGGGGQLVDVSMYEPMLSLLTPALAAWTAGTPPPGRTGSRVPGGVPRNVYRTADNRWVAVSGTTDAQVGRLLPLVGQATPEGRSRFARSADRLAHGDELDGLVAGWVAARSLDRVLAELAAIRIPVVPVNDLAGLVADPHARARASVTSVDDPVAGPVLIPAPSPVLGTTPGSVTRPAPALGAHTDEVVAEWLAGEGPDPDSHPMGHP